jgi:hypothetical protein
MNHSNSARQQHLFQKSSTWRDHERSPYQWASFPLFTVLIALGLCRWSKDVRIKAFSSGITGQRYEIGVTKSARVPVPVDIQVFNETVSEKGELAVSYLVDFVQSQSLSCWFNYPIDRNRVLEYKRQPIQEHWRAL